MAFAIVVEELTHNGVRLLVHDHTNSGLPGHEYEKIKSNWITFPFMGVARVRFHSYVDPTFREPSFRVDFENDRSFSDATTVRLVKDGEFVQLQLKCGFTLNFMHPTMLSSKWRHSDGSIRFEIKISRPISSQMDVVVPRSPLLSAFESGHDADVKFTHGDKTVQAARFILTSQSTVFAAMLANEWKDSKIAEINVEDVEYEVMEELIKSMYTGGIHNLNNPKFALELFVAADKYGVEFVKGDAEKFLIENISNDVVMFALKEADARKSEAIKEAALNFIGSPKCGPIANLPGFQFLDQNQIEIVFDKFQEAIKATNN